MSRFQQNVLITESTVQKYPKYSCPDSIIVLNGGTIGRGLRNNTATNIKYVRTAVVRYPIYHGQIVIKI